MRLSIIFLTVLALSALMTSMAAWGITYGMSYDKVSSMASEFTTLAQNNLNSFGLFVTDLLHGNAQLVDTILADQERSGAARTQQTKADMAQTIGTLVNYTTNTTDQTQQEMNAVVDTFAGLMDTVVTDFKGLASVYAEMVRNNLADTSSFVMSQYADEMRSMMKRLQDLLDIGQLDMTRAPTDPISQADCKLLAVVCDVAAESKFLLSLTVALGTGRLYACSASTGSTLSVVSTSGSLYNESQLMFAPMILPTLKQSCLALTPNAVQIVGKNCRLPQGCGCGADPRCSPWYAPQVSGSPFSFATRMYVDAFGTPMLHVSTPLFSDSSAIPPTFLGVADSQVPFSYFDSTFQAMLPSNDTRLAVLLNDTNFTAIANVVRQCAPNEIVPGDPTMPLRTGFRSCDRGLRQVAQFLDSHRTVTSSFTLQADGLDWSIYPGQFQYISWFLVVGTNRSVVYKAIDTSVNRAATQLSAVRTDLLQQVAASGQATEAYMALVGAQNIQATQAMQDSFLAQIQALADYSRAQLDASQQQSNAKLGSVTQAQAATVEAQKAYHLRSMAITSGWTMAVVLGILFVVLLLSAWGTIRITNSLLHIIGLMEDVAEMRVENLAVPQSAGVAEVSRIQSAFQVLVNRLAEYKGYIPAALYEKVDDADNADDNLADQERVPLSPRSTSTSSNPAANCTPKGNAASRSCRRSSSSSSAGLGRRGSVASAARGRRRSNSSNEMDGGHRKPALAVPAPPAVQQHSARRNVAVLSVNVVGFMDVLLGTNEAMAKSIFNDYVTHVHEAVSQGRGNIDCLLGDQVFVTFNAHIPCSDPAGAAAAAALDVRELLLLKMGDRLKFQIGVSSGPVVASSVGCTKFKSMVTVGSPMKLSSLLCRMTRLENRTILVDANLEERLRYSFTFRPVELMHIPRLKSFQKREPKSQRVFLLLCKKHLQEDEWLYQVEAGASSSVWNKTFDQLVAAKTSEEGQRLLSEYLAACPTDDIALRLRDRLVLWVPGLGIPL